MKIQFNITTTEEDLGRFADREEFLQLAGGFDGVELMYFGEDRRKIIPEEMIIGVHLSGFNCWVDFWNGNLEFCLKEYGSLEKCYEYYGGTGREAIVKRLRDDIAVAEKLGAEYMVYHVNDSPIVETMDMSFHLTNQQVIDATCQLINQVLPEDYDGPLLLLENLWHRGLIFKDPEETRRLMEGIKSDRVGLMLDTGHLIHSNMDITSQEEAVVYINSLLDRHGSLCRYIKGIHLNQSITGDFMARVKAKAPEMKETFEERFAQIFEYIFQVDKHQPFTAAGVPEMIKRISPEYVTFEFISSSLEEHREMLEAQWEVFDNEK